MLSSLKVTLQDCFFSIYGTPPPQPPAPGYTTPPANPPQLLGTLNARGSTCTRRSVLGCRVTARHSKAALALRVGSEQYPTELQVTVDDDGDCATLKCKLTIYEAALANNVNVTAQGNASVAAGVVSINGTIAVNTKKTLFDQEFSVAVCCEEGGDPCRMRCKLVNPPDGILV